MESGRVSDDRECWGDLSLSSDLYSLCQSFQPQAKALESVVWWWVCTNVSTESFMSHTGLTGIVSDLGRQAQVSPQEYWLIHSRMIMKNMWDLSCVNLHFTVNIDQLNGCKSWQATVLRELCFGVEAEISHHVTLCPVTLVQVDDTNLSMFPWEHEIQIISQCPVTTQSLMWCVPVNRWAFCTYPWLQLVFLLIVLIIFMMAHVPRHTTPSLHLSVSFPFLFVRLLGFLKADHLL